MTSIAPATDKSLPLAAAAAEHPEDFGVFTEGGPNRSTPLPGAGQRPRFRGYSPRVQRPESLYGPRDPGCDTHGGSLFFPGEGLFYPKMADPDRWQSAWPTPRPAAPICVTRLIGRGAGSWGLHPATSPGGRLRIPPSSPRGYSVPFPGAIGGITRFSTGVHTTPP